MWIDFSVNSFQEISTFLLQVATLRSGRAALSRIVCVDLLIFLEEIVPKLNIYRMDKRIAHFITVSFLKSIQINANQWLQCANLGEYLYSGKTKSDSVDETFMPL
ncbi:MAG: hypothetical protein M0R33_14120 [Methylomonas sp.]|jgi:hypothetical protein|uniref:hypothetical protein n=1 Tax=Methylomonas sp. TaxID=418 RepID=UPI0025E2A6D6|nr:hypothetical protein [Methylomonas sp.]MCK9607573.1 hypothetical protein [Methylomonas sp.]